MTPDVRVRASARSDSYAVGNGFLQYDGQTLGLLTGSGAVIWSHIDDVSTADEIAARVFRAARRGDQDADVSSEVLDFLRELAAQGVVDVLRAPDEVGYTRPRSVGFARDGQNVLLVDMRRGRRRVLTSTGSQVWELACDLHYASLIRATLRERFSDAGPRLDSDVDGLLDDLVAQGFLRARSPDPTRRA